MRSEHERKAVFQREVSVSGGASRSPRGRRYVSDDPPGRGKPASRGGSRDGGKPKPIPGAYQWLDGTDFRAGGGWLRTLPQLHPPPHPHRVLRRAERALAPRALYAEAEADAEVVARAAQSPCGADYEPVCPPNCGKIGGQAVRTRTNRPKRALCPRRSSWREADSGGLSRGRSLLATHLRHTTASGSPRLKTTSSPGPAPGPAASTEAAAACTAAGSAMSRRKPRTRPFRGSRNASRLGNATGHAQRRIQRSVLVDLDHHFELRPNEVARKM